MDDPVQDLFSQIGMRPFEVFYHVVELGGFSEAASELNLSQPTVSQHVKNLEETLGEPLILRQNSGLTLTPMGEICFEKMRELQAARDDLEDALQSHRQASQQELSIGASTIPGEFLLPRVLPEFRETHQTVTVDMTIDESSSLLTRIEDGKLRWGLTGTKPDSSTLQSEPLVVETMRLVTASGTSAPERLESPEALQALSYVGRGVQSGTRQAVRDFIARSGFDPSDCLSPVARLGTVQSVREAVINGMGVSFLPESVVEKDLRNGRVRTIETEFGPIERVFYGVENRFLGVSPVIETFRTFLTDHDTLGMVE